METPDSLNQVALFHKTFKAPVLNAPEIPAPDRCALRVSLLAEELEELKTAIAENDLTEIADALCDLQYVLSGAVLEFGLGDQFKGLFDEVQRSNMSKACKSLEEAEASVKNYHSKGVECYYEKSGELYLLYRKSDKKVMKSINYSPAQLKELL